MIKAEVICDSISEQGKRLTTYRLRYPRFIHAEFMTHRVISRNASSSRALPVAKLLEEVTTKELRAAPVFWGGERKGMQVGAELEGVYLKDAQYQWGMAAHQAAEWARAMIDTGVHKSIINRILEPFSHINVVATATEWDNFFGLRLDAAAEPTMKALAVAMWEAREASTPNLLKPGEWHLPFIKNGFKDSIETIKQAYKLSAEVEDEEGKQRVYLNALIKISIARCARVSYQSFDTGRQSTIEEDFALCDRLLGAQPLHASPAEHQATPDVPKYEHWRDSDGSGASDKVQVGWMADVQHGNFVGWCQYRKMLAGESVAPLPKEYVK